MLPLLSLAVPEHCCCCCAWLLAVLQVLVHTPLTVRAAELQQLYRGLTLPSLSLDEQLDVLLHVKWVAKEWDCGVTRELVELIDREADLLNRWDREGGREGGRDPAVAAGGHMRCFQQAVGSGLAWMAAGGGCGAVADERHLQAGVVVVVWP